MSRYSARHAARVGRIRAITSTVTSALMVATFATFIATPEAASAATTIPSRFVTVIDSGGANDVNSEQNDLTQMGRDDTTAPTYYDLFWSWDTTNFTAQKGNGCALFDTDGDGNVNFAICAEVENVPSGNTSVVKQTTISPVAVTCNDAWTNRCGNPSPADFTSSQLYARSLFNDANGNLVTDTDPFPDLIPDQRWPNDSTIELLAAKSWLPTGATLVNVCTYPSLGNTGNNNPFDCVVTPGAGLLKITKVAPNGTTQTFDFTVNPGSISKSILGSGSTANFPVPIGTSYSVTETVPTGWHLDSAACTLEDGTSTGSASSTGVTAVTVKSGQLTTCTFTDSKKPSAAVQKDNDANHDGTYTDSETVGAAVTYPYTVTYKAIITNNGPSPATIDSITDDKQAAPLDTAGAGLTSCSSLIGDPIGAGASETCYFDVTFASPRDPVTNTLSITLKNDAGSDTKTDTSTVTFTKKPELTLDKTASPTSYDAAGNVISYSYKLTNSGNVTLSGPFTVTDDKASVTCPATPTSLAPGDTITCTATYTISQADLDAGTVKNTAKGHGFFGTTPVDSNEDTATVTATQDAELTLVKTATPTTYDEVGDVISYSYELTNSGNVTLKEPFSITDDKATDEACPPTPTSLTPGASITCTASYTISQSDLDAGTVKNTATGHGFFGETAVDSNEDSATVTAVQTPALTLEKTADPTTYDSVGDVISYSYKLTNSGNVTLIAPFTVTDNVVTVSCPATPTSLAPGASITCDASYMITLVDLDAGSVINTATGHGFFGETPVNSNEDTATVTAVPNAKLTLVKTASPSTYDSVGDVINYSYVLTNSGNVTLIAPFTVADDKAGDEACPGTPTSLAPGDSITCTASYTISQADLDAGSVTNTAQGHGMFKTTPVDSNYDDETVTAVQDPKLALDKTATPATYSAVGQTISYSYVLLNSGNVTLSGPFTVDDDKATVSCPATASLAPGVSITCDASYAITQADLDAGSVVNTATGHGSFNGKTVDSNLDSETVTADKKPALSIVKTATPSTYDSVGDVISYGYLVTNSGNVTLFNLSVVDDLATVTCPDTSAGLAPQAQVTCTASYTISQADLDSGSVTNTAYATDGTTQSPPDSETVTADKLPALSIVKTATPSSYDSVGDVISYSYLVKNTGNVTLHGITVVDDKATVSCPAEAAELAPLAELTCTASYTITQADLDAGKVTNSAYATDGTTQSPPDEETVTADKLPALSIVKTATPSSYDSVGDVISYSYLVKNTGNVTLHDITVVDDKATVSCPAEAAELAPLAELTCTASYTITQADLNAGSVTNSAYATDGATQSPPDSETVTADQHPALTIDKTATPGSYDTVGQVISYSYLVTNSGNVTLYDIAVVDDKATVTCPDTSAGLAPLDTITCSASYTIAQGDLDAGSVKNTAYATDGTTKSEPDSETVNAVQSPALMLNKSATPAVYDHAGQVISYSYVVTNTGNVTVVAPFSITDDRASDEACPSTPASLAPGESITCTASYPISQVDVDAGSVTNVATAYGSFNGGQVTSNEDTETVTADKKPALQIVKTATPSTYDSVGDVISYSYLVTNSGNVTLFNVGVVDDKAAVSCADTSAGLAPLDTITCTASYTVTQADLDSGSVTNSAFATDGTTQSPPDSETVNAEQHPALTIEKSATPVVYDHAGQVISYSYELTNSGNVTVSGPFTVTDDKATDAACPVTPASLVPGDSITCTASYTIKQSDVDAGSVTNLATGHGFFGGAPVDSNEDYATVTADKLPALSILKTATPSSYSAVGEVIHYSYLVTNSGNVTLFNISVVDDKATVACPDTSAGLAPLGTITCSASYTIGQSDLDAGKVTNSAYAKSGDTQSPPDSETVTAEQHPALTIDKTASPSTYDAVGQVIHYSYLVTNSGNVTLFNVGVVDDKATVTCPDTSAGLAPLGTITCSASYPIAQGDLDAGSVTNTAYAKSGTTQSEPDSETVTADQNPALAIVKTATPATYDAVGNVISYSYLVENTGNVTLFNITVTDDKAAVTCPDTSAGLAPLGTITCTASYTIAQSDLDVGSVTNTAYAKSGTTVSEPDSETVTADQKPALSIVKIATPATYDAVGNVISYTYLVENTGNVTLFNITVVDNKATVTCPSTAAGLAPLGTITCTAVYTIAQSDLDGGSVTNTAYATDGTIQSPPDSETVTADKKPALSIVKTATPATYDAVGDVVSYSYLVENTGNVTLFNVTVVDDKATVSCPAEAATMAPDDQVTCTASYTIKQSDLDAGSVKNTAYATDGTTLSPPDSETVNAEQNPALTIDKTAGPATYDAVGDVISYSYKLSNSGNVTLSGPFTVTDNKATVSCPATASLGPAAFITCTASYPISQSDLDAGSVTNTATGHGFFGTTPVTSNEDSETVTAEQHPALTLVKSASPTSYDQVGDVISYSYRLTNSGNVTVSGPFTITDDKASDEACPATPTSLAPGVWITCTASYPISQSDLDAGSVKNTATGHGYFGTDPVDSNQDDETVWAVSGQITPTGTTCSQFASRTAADLDAIQYTLKGTKINSVSPGVLFYWVKVTGGGTYTIDQALSTNALKTPFAMASGSAVWDANCLKVQDAVIAYAKSGDVTVTFSGTGTFYIGIKYDPASVVGKSKPNPPTVTYSFSTSGVPASGDSILLTPKSTGPTANKI